MNRRYRTNETRNEKIAQEIIWELLNKGIRTSNHDADETGIHIEPDTRTTGDLPPGAFDGLQLNFFTREGIWEVSEYQAGPNENELHIFTETRYQAVAIRSLLKGNKRKPIKVWK